jgi:hypothetical protein
MKKLLSLFILPLIWLSLPFGSLQAGGCCDTSCCGPLKECAFSATVKGGVSPTHWTHRGRVWLTSEVLVPPISVSQVSKYKNQFQTPWTVGGELAYNTSCNNQVFIEFNYFRGKHKTFDFLAGAFEVSETFSDWEGWSGYLGARHFFDRCWICNKLSPFVGIKAGYTKTSEVTYDLHLFGNFVQTSPYYLGTGAVSAGAQIGFDFEITKCLSAILNFELVASQAPEANTNVVFKDTVASLGLTNVNIGQIRTVISIPITLGLRMTF